MIRAFFHETFRRTLAASLLKPGIATATAGDWKSIGQWLPVYQKLSKAKLSSFVVFSAATGFVLASKDDINWRKLGATAVGTFAASASANTLNQIYEREKDALMSRTRLRPLPLGKISTKHALAFALVTGIVGVTLLSQQTNDQAAALATGNIILYACVYTPLKQVTVWNTWIGAIVGAIPPLIGWTAAREQIDPGAMVLFSALYFWQIPHFLSLAWTYKADYANAGYCMMSKYDVTGRSLASCAFRNCVYLLPLGFLSSHLGMTSSWFSYEAFLLTLGISLSAASFLDTRTKGRSRSLFKTSIVYLPSILALMWIHRRTENENMTWSDVYEEMGYLRRRWLMKPRRRDMELNEAGQTPLVVPFPFAPLPPTETPSSFLWDGLDQVIEEMEEGERRCGC